MPDDSKETDMMGKKVRYLGLQRKLVISFSMLTIVTSALLTCALYQSVKGRLREDIRRRLYDVVSISALQIDGDAHASLISPEQENSDTYMRIKCVLQDIREKATDVRYVYTWRRNVDGRIIFVVDAETDPEEISHLGDAYVSSEPEVLEKLVVLNQPTVDEDFTTDKWGVWLSGYAPFYKSDGQMEGILGMDIAASNVLSHERKFLWIAIGVFAGTIPLASILGWFLGRRLAGPIIRLTVGSEIIAKGNLDHKVVVQNNDEVGILAAAFNRMTESLQKTIIDRDREINNRKQVEEVLDIVNQDLDTTVRQLSKVNRELKEFAYIAAHDLKSPVRAIGSLTGMISEDCKDILDDNSKQKLDLIARRTERMDEFINGILKYAAVGHSFIQKEKVDIDNIVADVIEQVGAVVENIEITVRNKLPVVIAQKTHIVQIFQNLIDNAVRYMDKPNGRIIIDCIEQENFFQFSIADNGPGIEEKYFDKIFQIFQTLTRRDESEATGIGLSIVKKIVELDDGKIWVESKMGEGSIFYFTLPKQMKEIFN